ncbi:MAG: hypothetical protein IPO77_07955 [Acidobacteria bacterium]|nr:hypothetical protein [Acidobacteriota bacterium]
MTAVEEITPNVAAETLVPGALNWGVLNALAVWEPALHLGLLDLALRIESEGDARFAHRGIRPFDMEAALARS